MLCFQDTSFIFFLNFPFHSSRLAFPVMNLNYAKVTFHCGDLSVALLELAVLAHYHGHAYWQPFPSQRQNKQERK